MDLQAVLREETVGHIGYREVMRVSPQKTLREAIALMRAERLGSVLICDGERLVGLFTERDLLRRFAAGEPGLDQPISAHMTRDPVTAKLDESIAAVIRKMRDGGFRRLPVIDEAGRPLGILSVKRIVKHIAEFFPDAVFKIPPRPGQFAAQREGA